MAKNMATVLLSPQWKVCLLPAALEEGSLIGLPSATCIPGPIKGYGAMTGPAGVAGPTLWPGGQG